MVRGGRESRQGIRDPWAGAKLAGYTALEGLAGWPADCCMAAPGGACKCAACMQAPALLQAVLECAATAKHSRNTRRCCSSQAAQPREQRPWHAAQPPAAHLGNLSMAWLIEARISMMRCARFAGSILCTVSVDASCTSLLGCRSSSARNCGRERGGRQRRWRT